MFGYLKTWMELKSDRRAITMLEYAIMGSLIAAGLVAAVPALLTAVGTSFAHIAAAVG